MSPSLSRQVDEIGLVVLVSLHVPVTNKHLNLLFDHLWLCPEHGNVAHHVGLQVHELVLLLRLHDLDDVHLTDGLALPGNLLCLLRLVFGRLNRLLFDLFLRNEIAADLVARVLRINFDFLVGSEHRLVGFFQKHFYLRVTKLHHGTFKLFLRHLSNTQDLLARKLLLVIK